MLFVPHVFVDMYLPAIYAGLIVGFIATMAIAMKRKELHILILTDIVGLAMIFVVSAVGTDCMRSGNTAQRMPRKARKIQLRRWRSLN